jgi:uncharacterized protein with von Willebrand factor type A (vWA) domain
MASSNKVFNADPLGLAIGKKNGLDKLQAEFFSHFYATTDSPVMDIPADRKYGDIAKELKNSSEYNKIISKTEFNHILSKKATSAIFDEAESSDTSDDSKRRNVINAALAKASKEYDENDSMFVAIGGGASLSHESVQNDPEYPEYEENMRRVKDNQYFKNFLKIVGRLRAMATDKIKNKIVYEGVEMHGISFGNDLEKVMPQEFAMLSHPVLRADFMLRFAEARLMQFEFVTKTDSSDGPIIVLGDESASMNDTSRSMMYAVLAGTISLAKIDSREVVYIGFSDHTSKPVLFKPGDSEVCTANKMINVMRGFMKQGTCYSAALLAAHELTKDKYKLGDIVMLTDGMYAVADKLAIESAMSSIKSSNTRVFGILIDSDNNYADHLRRDFGFSKVTLLSSNKTDFSEAELRGIGDKIYSSLCEKKG